MLNHAIPEQLRTSLGTILLSHRIGEISVAESCALIEGLLDSHDLHTEVEKLRAARRRDDSRRTDATRQYTLIG